MLETRSADRISSEIVAIDGAQVVGIQPVNLHDIGCDFYAKSLHKWAVAPAGSGMLYVKKDMQQQFWPRAGGTSPWDESAQGFGLVEDIGTHAVPLRLTVGDALDLIDRIALKHIVARTRMLFDYLKTELIKRPYIRLATSLSPELSEVDLFLDAPDTAGG